MAFDNGNIQANKTRPADQIFEVRIKYKLQSFLDPDPVVFYNGLTITIISPVQ